MEDNLPLIPEKEAVCADVRPVLREVFRGLDCLPPLAPGAPRPHPRVADGDSLPKVEPWIPKLELESNELWRREGELKQQHARRISREPLPNIYKLHAPKETQSTSSWKREKGILQRRDLMPSIVQDASRTDSLWVRNILNTSSGDLSSAELKGSRIGMPIPLESPRESSLSSISFGELVVPPPPLPPPVAPPPLLPEYILCVPPQLDFVNFTVGQLQTQSLRLVNVSKFECRLSVRPPSRRELDVQLCGARGLTVTSGAVAQLKVHFRPRNVRVLRDELVVRVSTGRALRVPICCYMQPPLLDIMVPAFATSITSWCGAGGGVGGGEGARGGDVLELGARLLGDEHEVRALLHCDAQHAAFFLLTEDAWLNCCLDALSCDGSLVAPPFVVSPAWWRGGGAVRARVRCRAPAAGLHAAALRLLASTAVLRPLHLLADALYYRPDHVTIEAHEKDYDICSEDDPACQYYVHLGTAFPRQQLAATVQLVNHSAVVYSFYWSLRPWGVCSCWQEQKATEGSLGPEDDVDQLCVGAKEAREMELEGREPARAEPVCAEPARGSVGPRAGCALRVRAPDSGQRLGTRRAVLMLILKDIPKESFPSDFEPMIVRTREVDCEPFPGMKVSRREVCDVVCAQLEVWWDVAPVRFVLDPPLLPLTHSRRVQAVDIQVLATQLFGCAALAGTWRVAGALPPPPPAALPAAHSCAVPLRWPLPVLPNDYPETDIITLQSVGGEWSASCRLVRACATRHPALRPARAWLGVVPPAARMRTDLHVLNDTHQHICWWATPFRWQGENPASRACAGRAACSQCHERRCSCALLRPTRGALAPSAAQDILYEVNAPERDGCVATLVQARRTAADVCRLAGAAGQCARAALLAYRVLAPRLVLRALPCLGDKTHQCAGCALDCGAAGGARGTATLRPRAALTAGRAACARLRLTNLTPIPTTVSWDPPLEDDVLSVVLFPNELPVEGYGEVVFQVVLRARRVCGRRVWLRRARAAHAYQPLYLLVDAAIALPVSRYVEFRINNFPGATRHGQHHVVVDKGLEIVYEVPLGDGEQTDATLVMRRSQREEFPWDSPVQAATPEELFLEEDRKRAVRAENICGCHFELTYVPPPRRARPPDDPPPVDIVTSPPQLTRVCACFGVSKPPLPAHAHTYALQFRDMPLNTVCGRTLRLRNVSQLDARWRVALRRHARPPARHLAAGVGAGDAGDAGGAGGAGLAAWCCPGEGVLRARCSLDLRLQLLADCWGLYHDQLLIEVERVEPLVLDVWAEARGSPLQFALARAPAADPLLLWQVTAACCRLSAADPARTLRVKNRSRSPLLVHAYLLTEHARAQDARPLRLYLRLLDELPRTCPCLAALRGETYGEHSAESSSSYEEEMDTGFELYLAPDYGRQGSECFTVSPETTTVPPGVWAEWRVTLTAPAQGEAAPAALLLRALPLLNRGEGWFRGDPPAAAVRLRQAARAARLKASARLLRVTLCALDLPYGDVLRVRKHFRIQNIGCGPLECSARCAAPWALAPGPAARCGAGCACAPPAAPAPDSPPDSARLFERSLHLLPRSSQELCVEVRVVTAEAWPAPPTPPTPPTPPAPPACPASPALPALPAPAGPQYEQWRRSVTKLRFYDSYNVLLTVPLHLELEYPVISIEPAVLDFGFVTDGDTRKSYFTVSHSSRTATVDMVSAWQGPPHFRLWPRDFSLQPGGRERLYIQYTARWSGAPAEGRARAAAACGAGAWCCAAARATARPARPADRRRAARDHTDDPHLLAPVPAAPAPAAPAPAAPAPAAPAPAAPAPAAPAPAAPAPPAPAADE